MVMGLQLMGWGFSKKVVIADRMAPMVDSVYSHPANFAGPSRLLATVLFSFQIFCDFSGYSNIALGSGRVMGYELMTNFDRPYSSKNITEFWRRWPISLSTWFRDYVYIPPGGNPVALWQQGLNRVLVFMISGIRHGANWTFVLWGGLHGLYLLLELVARRGRRRVIPAYSVAGKLWRVGFTFLLVSFAWIFFRATSVGDAFYIIGHLATGWIGLAGRLHNPAFVGANILLGESSQLVGVVLLAIGLMEVVHYFQRHPHWQVGFRRKPVWVRWSIYYAGALLLLLFGVYNKPVQFIYFRF